MKIVKKIVVGLIVIIALISIVGLFLPAKFHMERTITVNAEPAAVFEQVNNLQNWNNWCPWNKMDTAWVQTFGGSASGVGAAYSWKSEMMEVGNGSMKITSSAPNDSVIVELNFMEHGTSRGSFHFNKTDSGTALTWGFDSDAGWDLISRYMRLFMEGELDKNMNEGLAEIKKIAESMPKAAPHVQIETSTMEAMKVLTIKDSCTMADISQKLGGIYGEIGMEMGKANAAQAGAVFAIYHNVVKNADGSMKFVLEAGIPVDKVCKPSGRVKYWEMKPGTVVVANHYGKYEATEQTHALVDEWLKANNRKVTGAPWEAYVTDPGKEPDTMKWLTRIYYPVE